MMGGNVGFALSNYIMEGICVLKQNYGILYKYDGITEPSLQLSILETSNYIT